MNYYEKLEDDIFTYSIDMLRLKTYLFSYDVVNLRFSLKEYFNLEFFSSFGFGKFPENWKCDSVWIGLGAKTKNKDNNHIILCVEFNPNKLTDNDISLLYYLFDSFDFTVTRYDLAIDIPYNINQLYFGDLYKKNYSLFYNDFNNKTYYFGKGNGHTKIYNKKIESNLDYELTRYEVTLETDFNLQKGLPNANNINFITVCRTPYFSLSGDSTLDVILYAVNNGFPFKSLSRRYKDLIRKDFIGLSEISNISAYNCLIKFLKKFRTEFFSRII